MAVPTRPLDLYFALVTGLAATIRITGSFRLGRLVSRAAAGSAYLLLVGRRRAKERGITIALGPLGDQEMRRLIVGGYLNFWEDLLLNLPIERSDSGKSFLVEGEEHLQAALADGHGAILWESNAFGRRTLAKQVLAERGHRIVQVHLENHLGGLRNDGLHRSRLRARVIHPAWEVWEKEYVEEIVSLPRDGSLAYVRTLRHRLRDNKIICSAADGSWGEKTLPIPFLGGVRPFSTGMVSLSRLTGAPLMPLFCWREKNGNYRVRVFPPLFHPPRTDREEATRRTLTEFAQLFETCVREHPDQYHDWQGTI